MTTQEKILLLEYLLVDIRLDWDKGKHKRFKDKRVWAAIKIINELSIISPPISYKKRIYNWKGELVTSYEEAIVGYKWDKMLEPIGLYLTGCYEGKIVKCDFKEGGYDGLDEIHQLSPNFSERSEEFRKKVNELLRVDYNWKRQ